MKTLLTAISTMMILTACGQQNIASSVKSDDANGLGYGLTCETQVGLMAIYPNLEDDRQTVTVDHDGTKSEHLFEVSKNAQGELEYKIYGWMEQSDFLTLTIGSDPVLKGDFDGAGTSNPVALNAVCEYL